MVAFSSLLDLFLKPEDWGSMFLRNVDEISPDYTQGDSTLHSYRYEDLKSNNGKCYFWVSAQIAVTFDNRDPQFDVNSIDRSRQFIKEDQVLIRRSDHGADTAIDRDV
jgi:hypothetical protein